MEQRRSRRNMATALLAMLALVACSKATEVPSTSPTTTMPPASFAPSAVPSVVPVDGECTTTVPPTQPKAQFDVAPDSVIDPAKNYTATMETSCGTIVFELLNDSAPTTVNNFVYLAQQGWYDGTLFHRISNSIDIIQAGDALCTDQPSLCGTGNPGYSIPDELTGNEEYAPGVVAMANAGPDTGGSQFFIVTGPAAGVLAPDYPVFGQITEGLDVAQKIQEQAVTGETPTENIWIVSVTIAETG